MLVDEPPPRTRPSPAPLRGSPGSSQAPAGPQRRDRAEDPPETASRTRPPPSRERVQEPRVKEAFDLFDTDGAGHLDLDEFRVFLRALGFELSQGNLNKLLTIVQCDDGDAIPLAKALLMVRSLEDIDLQAPAR